MTQRSDGYGEMSRTTRTITGVVFTLIIVFQILVLFTDYRLTPRTLLILDVAVMVAFAGLAIWYTVRRPLGVSRRMQVFCISTFAVIAVWKAFDSVR